MRVQGICHKRGRKGGARVQSPAGVWGVPSFSFSSLAAAGGKESLKSAPLGCPLTFPSLQRGCYALVS
jgi:hypothetical protein